MTVDVSDVLWNRTAGLCGRINGFWMDDFENRDGTRSSSLLGFVNSWEASGLTGDLLLGITLSIKLISSVSQCRSVPEQPEREARVQRR